MNQAQDPEWLIKLRNMHPFKLFMWVAIIGIGIMFLFLLMGFVLTNDIRKFYLPKFFTFSTLLILVSSYSMARTKGAFKADNIKLLHTSLLFSFLLAQLFIYSQLKGWRELDEHGIYFSGEANGSYLYLLSGLHLAHFLGGIIYLFIVYLKVYQAFRDPVKNIIYVTDPFEAMKLDLLNLYWHFMGVLWLIMYLVFFAFTM